MARLLAFALLMMLVSGCGAPAVEHPELPELVKVSGKVTMDGKPLADTVVHFAPLKDGGFPATGSTNAEGEYQLSTFQGAEKHEGAAPGEYRVRMSRFLKPDGTPADPSQPPANSAAMETMPMKYSSSTASELMATVEADGGTFDWKLDSKDTLPKPQKAAP